jgi:hypothetical protein
MQKIAVVGSPSSGGVTELICETDAITPSWKTDGQAFTTITCTTHQKNRYLTIAISEIDVQNAEERIAITELDALAAPQFVAALAYMFGQRADLVEDGWAGSLQGGTSTRTFSLEDSNEDSAIGLLPDPSPVLMKKAHLDELTDIAEVLETLDRRLHALSTLHIKGYRQSEGGSRRPDEWFNVGGPLHAAVQALADVAIDIRSGVSAAQIVE